MGAYPFAPNSNFLSTNKLNNNADIILIYPKTGVDFGSTVAPPHSILSVAAPLHKEGYKVKIIDQRTDLHWDKSLESGISSKTICIGISCMTGTQIYFAIEAAKVIRNIDSRVPIVWGGPHPSILPEQTCQSEYVDIVCVGEGDITFSEIVKALQAKTPLETINGIAFKDSNRIIITPERLLLDVETLLPVPWELVNVEDYIHPDFYLKESPRTLDIGQTSRGCPFNCGFCCSSALQKHKWRPMSVEKALEVIVDPVKRFKLNGIWIRDDEFYINRDRVNNICEGIIKANLKIHWYTSGTRADIFSRASEEEVDLLKKSGAYVLKFGAESGSNRILKLMNKGITLQDTIEANLKAKRHGIIPAFALMVGFPTETFEEINQTIDFVSKLRKDNPKAQFETIAGYTAYPGTPLYELALKYGLKPPQSLEDWIDWNVAEYDPLGVRIPWFNYEDRIKIGNISYMSILANALGNTIDGVKNIYLRNILKIISIPISLYYRLRLKRKWYSFVPELMVIRYIRKIFFYRSRFTIK